MEIEEEEEKEKEKKMSAGSQARRPYMTRRDSESTRRGTEVCTRAQLASD